MPASLAAAAVAERNLLRLETFKADRTIARPFLNTTDWLKAVAIEPFGSAIALR